MTATLFFLSLGLAAGRPADTDLLTDLRSLESHLNQAVIQESQLDLQVMRAKENEQGKAKAPSNCPECGEVEGDYQPPPDTVPKVWQMNCMTANYKPCQSDADCPNTCELKSQKIPHVPMSCVREPADFFPECHQQACCVAGNEGIGFLGPMGEFQPKIPRRAKDTYEIQDGFMCVDEVTDDKAFDFSCKNLKDCIGKGQDMCDSKPECAGLMYADRWKPDKVIMCRASKLTRDRNRIGWKTRMKGWAQQGRQQVPYVDSKEVLPHPVPSRIVTPTPEPPLRVQPPCPNNHYVSNHHCLPCPSGARNENRDDPTGFDTTCTAVPCPEGSVGLVYGKSGTGGLSGCKTATGWKGSVAASAMFPYYTSTLASCPPVRSDGHCGPRFGGALCAGNPSWAVYCNTDNGWCGKTKATKNAQPSGEFDLDKLPDTCKGSKAMTKAACETAHNEGQCANTMMEASHTINAGSQRFFSDSGVVAGRVYGCRWLANGCRIDGNRELARSKEALETPGADANTNPPLAVPNAVNPIEQMRNDVVRGVKNALDQSWLTKDQPHTPTKIVPLPPPPMPILSPNSPASPTASRPNDAVFGPHNDKAFVNRNGQVGNAPEGPFYNTATKGLPEGSHNIGNLPVSGKGTNIKINTPTGTKSFKNPEGCPPINLEGRCGPRWGGTICSGRPAWAMWCNLQSGWCGNTDTHKQQRGDEDKKFDITMLPQQCKNTLSCPKTNSDGRCGPQFAGAKCAGHPDWAVYCNTANGWCGNTDEHKNAQPGTEYDMGSLPPDCATQQSNCPGPVRSDGRCGPKHQNAICGGQPADAVYCNTDSGQCVASEAGKNPGAGNAYDISALPEKCRHIGCPLVRLDGRCGPKNDGAVCGGDPESAIYCNTESGECGKTDAFKNAQPGTEFDYSALDPKCRNTPAPAGGSLGGCPPINAQHRCGPKFGEAVCSGEGGASFCNIATGTCGKKPAQPRAEYDHSAMPDHCKGKNQPKQEMKTAFCKTGRTQEMCATLQMVAGSDLPGEGVVRGNMYGCKWYGGACQIDGARKMPK